VSETRPQVTTGTPGEETLEPRLRDLSPIRRLPGRNRTKADVLVYRLDEAEIAVKDYAPRPWWVRHTLGRWLTGREAAAYRAARGVHGVPEFLGRLGPWTLATRWVDALPLAELQADRPDPDWYDGLAALVARLHDRGIALADLHHRDVLVGHDGEPWIVDLAMASVLAPGAGRLRRHWHERLKDLDRIAVARMRARAEGRDPDLAVERIGGASAAWYRRGRRLKRLLLEPRRRRR